MSEHRECRFCGELIQDNPPCCLEREQELATSDRIRALEAEIAYARKAIPALYIERAEKAEADLAALAEDTKGLAENVLRLNAELWRTSAVIAALYVVMRKRLRLQRRQAMGRGGAIKKRCPPGLVLDHSNTQQRGRRSEDTR